MTRQTCDDCGLSYRYQVDFEEHKRVGCRPEVSDRPTWSDKEDEQPEGLELPAAVQTELIAEASASTLIPEVDSLEALTASPKKKTKV